MSEFILFPSSTPSKLSACPSTKIPQTTDWILQDFYDTQLQGHHQFSDDLIASWFEYSNVVALEDDPLPDLDSARSSDYGDDAEEELTRYIEMFPTPTSLKPDRFHSADEMPPNQLDDRGRSDRYLTKRKSTSSFSSFRSVMHLFQGKKLKSERKSKADGSNRLFDYFRRH
ncbi:hypothetical protein A0J61_10448 [Choanephora cucurbitarum]|uniref:Uncharacterized protein n=1 Tax=Choanephora cucurbitarum TaxID=101091 RepID=A0A1C7MXF6_9FUNG|nr:hypothetical protein A0J61_10448 [Choanephora cucurbitarum]